MIYSNKTVIVTGSGSGIGRCVAMTYAAEGARVIIAEMNNETGYETEKQIRMAGGEAIFIRTDVTRVSDITRMTVRAAELYGTIDIQINNAGLSLFRSPYDLTVDEWDMMLNTNLRGVFLCSREAARIMKEHGGGSIVNIGSTRAFMSEPGSEAYGASKGGVVALTHALAASLSPDRIRVNCISPGWVETGDYNLLKERDHRQHFSGRVGKPEDIAKACLWLTDEKNEFVNGANIIIDGGMTRKMIYE